MDLLKRLSLWVLCVFAAIFALAWQFVAAFSTGNRYWRIAIGMDQAANAAFGGNEDMTISTRAALARKQGRRWGCVLCKLLDAVDKDHCERSTN